MQYLDTLLRLLSKTDTRDQLLRLVQYATIWSEDELSKGASFNVYNNIRRTRKWLRFLRTIEFLRQIKADFGKLAKSRDFTLTLFRIFTIMEEIFRVLFYLFDHHVVLGQLEIVSKQHATIFYSRSIKMYLLQNIFGAMKSFLAIIALTKNGSLSQGLSEEEPLRKGEQMIRNHSIDLLKNILDMFIAWYYLKKPTGLASRAGVVGVVTTLIGLAQAEKLI